MLELFIGLWLSSDLEMIAVFYGNYFNIYSLSITAWSK
jgi:hypothetical protein